ncbi:tsr1 [Scenedesmus sp. PABB004]|nr:tsr1 [Scenedesmus sp. PABB004]
MGGPSAHGQRNKSHKAGRHAGKSARDKHKAKKEGGGASRASVKAAGHGNKLERAAAAKQQRDAKRAALLEERRRHSAPVVVALLPLTSDVDAAPLWAALLAAASGAPADDSGGGGLVTIAVQGRRRVRLTLLPPPPDRDDPLAIVDVAKAAEVLLLLLPGHDGAAPVDAAGEAALAVLRAMGLPTTMAVVLSQPQQQPGGVDAMGVDGEDDAGAGAAGKGSAAAELKRRSAAKKRAEKALAAHLPGDMRLLCGDSGQDVQQLLRSLADCMPTLPVWRRQRPYIVVQHAAFTPSQPLQEQQQQQQQQQQQPGGDAQQQLGELRLTGFVRAAGLSANQLITLPGGGDFRIARIEGPPDMDAGGPGGGQQQQQQQQQRGQRGPGAGDADMADAGGAAPVLALPDPAQQEPCVRENEPDPLAGEQTWPTDEELADAAAAAAAGRKMRKRRLPAGTSEYQAAWILDDDEGSSGEDNDSASDGEDAAMAVPLSEGGGSGAADDDDGAALGDGEGEQSDGAAMEEDEAAEEAAARRLRDELKAKRLAEAEDAEFPDEVDTPQDVPARQRFAKYRGLKSFRSSPWDAREGLPLEYGRVFAFENFKRTHKRAREAAARATAGTDPCAVPPGSYVTVVLSGVPAAAAAAAVARAGPPPPPPAPGAPPRAGPPPLTVHGLLQHEAKLSVVNFSLKKAPGYADAVASKEELLLVTGLRAWRGRPVLSDDGGGSDKHKMERFLHPGKPGVGAVYAPISYPPLPLLAFKAEPGCRPRLAAAGALRSVDPDRVVVKKVVLSGYPVRVNKTRAVVRLMFFGPDDVRWFKPLELWTKSGRRGRITEPLGTHGAFKARFDGPVAQRDAVCVSLYKRVFPKWPTPGGGGGEAAADAHGGAAPALGMASFA